MSEPTQIQLEQLSPGAAAFVLLQLEATTDPSLCELIDPNSYWAVYTETVSISFYDGDRSALLARCVERFGGEPIVGNRSCGSGSVSKRLAVTWRDIELVLNFPVPEVSVIEDLRRELAALKASSAGTQVSA